MLMTIEERAKKGADSKARGVCNCTRAVLAAFEDVLKIDPDELTRLTAGFAAGMGNLEGTCGALVGAVMVAGILTDGKGTPRYSREIMEKFKEMSGSTICKDLKGMGDKPIRTECPICVANAILALGETVDVPE